RGPAGRDGAGDAGAGRELAVISTDVVDNVEGGEPAERGGGAGPVVKGEEAGQGHRSLVVRAVRSGIGPLVDQGLDEALGLAVGLRPEGTRPLVAGDGGSENRC